jgi:hypothetical protein
MSSGSYKARTDAPGFKSNILNLNYNANQPSMYEFPLSVGNVSETVEVTAQAAQVQTETSSISADKAPFNDRNYLQLQQLAPGVSNLNTASANVVNLQKRVAGVLPVAIDVPRAGTSFSFVRPLVLDEETKVTFSYKSR